MYTDKYKTTLIQHFCNNYVRKYTGKVMAFFGIYNILCHVMELVIHPGNVNIPKNKDFAKNAKKY